MTIYPNEHSEDAMNKIMEIICENAEDEYAAGDFYVYVIQGVEFKIYT
jgi:hypothetical protein